MPSNTAQSLFKPFPRNQLAIEAQSFPRKSSKGLFVIYAKGGVGDFQAIQAYQKFTPPRKWVF